jgi:hypothetical protein
MSEADAGVVADRFENEEGMVYMGSPWADAREVVPDVWSRRPEQTYGSCRCGGKPDEVATFGCATTRGDVSGPVTAEPESISVDSVLLCAVDGRSVSEPREVENLRWLVEDLRGWVGVRIGFAPALAWPLADAWNRATKMLELLSKYIEERSYELPGDRGFAIGAAELVRRIGQVLAREGLGAAAAHHAVWMTAEAAEREARAKSA